MTRELLALPTEVVEMIFAQISDEPRHVVRLRLVCRYFNEAFSPKNYFPGKDPIRGILFPTYPPIAGDFLYRHVEDVRFRGGPPSPPQLCWGEFAQTVQQTVKDLLQHSDQHCSKAPDQYARELCSMAAVWSEIWYPSWGLHRVASIIRGRGAVDHTLVALAYFGRTAAFESLLPSCQTIHPASDHFGSALYWAICRGHTPIVNILLQRRRPGVSRPPLGFGLSRFRLSALSLAALNGHLDLVKVFILQDKTKAEDIIVALRTAAQAGQMDALQLVIESAPRFSNLGNWPLDVLLAAADSGQENIVDFALSELGADINGIITRGPPFASYSIWLARSNFSEKPAIYAAASHGYVGTVSYLLAKGAHFCGPWGNSLTPAIRRGYTRTVQVLLKAGVDLDTVNLEA